jgi:hypothetical protein
MSQIPKRSTIRNDFVARYAVALTASEILASPAISDDVDPPEPIDFSPPPPQATRRLVGTDAARLHRLSPAHARQGKRNGRPKDPAAVIA